MLLLLAALAGAADTAGVFLERIVVAPAETLLVQTEGSGPLVVLLPGLFGSAFGYRRVGPAIAAMGFRTVVIEPLAVGHSSRPTRADYSLTAQAGRIGRVLDSLGGGPAVIVAHSLSAGIALRLAWLRPERVSGLVLLEGGPIESAGSPGFRRAMQYAPWVKWAGGTRMIQKVIRQTLLGSAGDKSWVTDEVIAEYTSGPAGDLDGTLLAYLAIAKSKEPERLQSHLGGILCPILVLIGGAPHSGGPQQDEIDRLRQGSPDVVVETVAGVGHYIHEERPDLVIRAVASVTERAGGPTRTVLQH